MTDYLKPKGKIIIVDFMFANEEERERYHNKFIKDNRLDLWEAINRKYYSNIEKLESYLTSLNLKIEYKRLVNFTWVVEIFL